MQNDIVLTSGYAEDLENVRLGVWGRRGRRRGRGTAKADSCRGWGVGWVTSVSEAYAIDVHTHVHE